MTQGSSAPQGARIVTSDDHSTVRALDLFYSGCDEAGDETWDALITMDEWADLMQGYLAVACDLWPARTGIRFVMWMEGE